MLYHFSENPSINVFHPHRAATTDHNRDCVWAVDENHMPGFWFPRDCPRACCWLRTGQEASGFETLLCGARRAHAIQADWVDAMRACKLYVYLFSPRPFVLHNKEAGHWVSYETVRPVSTRPVGDLFGAHGGAAIPLLVVPDLRPLIAQIVESGLGFSIYRRRNLAQRR